ncbi:hypothetical protein SCLARK_001059 [Spiroplasma clarkii]|uniref:Uncharacterized protein n=1 Tax=Spiroplasma clarkii TaxID=2139 RepID=A0A1Y0L1R6_9MOLU|nr:hypothetical protein [Spiroplasma clarkii]ARU91639.1 hypothetical protein SCLARK_001059 [Spiroplasma clarkii]ATX71033.1 hypothetical protein SCLAR_v1c07160 [Spiroplasma clarkii]
MINLFKPFEPSLVNLTDLKNVNPFWSKSLKQRVSKLNKWLVKFSGNSQNFEIKSFTNYEEYPNLFKQVDHFKSFLNQKYSLIKTSTKMLSKFQKLIDNYCATLGIIKAIEIICNYYQSINYENISHKKLFIIDTSNEIIEKYLQSFRKKLETVLKKDKYIDLCFNNIVCTDSSLTNTFVFVGLTLKYVSILFKKKKLSEEDFIGLNAAMIEYYAFINDFSQVMNTFINSVY